MAGCFLLTSQGPTLRVSPSWSGYRRKARLRQASGTKQQNSGAFSCGIRTRTVAGGGPWLGSRKLSHCPVREIRGIRGAFVFDGYIRNYL
jgi:hypothetical protein